jgi:hypothetical protein
MKFKWTLKCKQVFNNLKYCFTTALILTYFNPDLKCVIEIDLSNYVLGGVLLQYNKNSKLRLVAFFF